MVPGPRTRIHDIWHTDGVPVNRRRGPRSIACSTQGPGLPVSGYLACFSDFPGPKITPFPDLKQGIEYLKFGGSNPSPATNLFEI